MFDVCGRRVKLATGKQTQTVNVCTQAGVAGEYEYILRIRPPFATEHDLKSGWFSSIEQFVTHVQDRHGGELERGPGFPSAQQQTAVNVAYGSQDRESSRHVNTPSILLSSWTIAARDATERSIDQLVLEFIQHPYYHRVEHSIHCRLFELMIRQHELQDDLSFGNRWSTKPIHKEWPEYVPRPGKGRGNFDLAVLSPEIVHSASLDDFLRGTIRPSIVIEMGLDYGYSHLAGDVRKLENSGIRDSYLIHLVRQHVPGDFDGIERLLLDCGFKSAYARHSGSRVRYKLVGEDRFRDTDG